MGCKKCEGSKCATTFPEYYKRIKFVEDTIIKLVAEMLGDNVKPSEKTEEVLDSSDPAEMSMYHLDIEDLSFLEVEQMKRAVSRLARKLSSRYSLRYKRAKHGGVDLRSTIRRAFVSTGGVPVDLKRRKRIISRPEIVLLCDVSESVAAFSHFMLQLVYAIQFRFSYVRSFLFVDLIDEVTPYFRTRGVDQAVQDALDHGKYSSGVFSDYGRVFELFARSYLPTISPRSTVIVLGDARNNHFPDYGKSFEKICESVRRVIWLNPQPKSEWNTRDNIMDLYSQHCHEVYECSTLRQLERIMDNLV
jgi:uncharacterized protein with von Willebrand factor type A (vWA) domain